MSARQIILFFAGLLVLLALGLLFFLSPWAPFQLPFLVTPLPAAPYVEPAAGTPTATHAATTATPLPTLTPSPTFTPVPTRKSPYPYGLNTPVPDAGQPPIALENVPQLRPIYSIPEQKIWHTAASGDGQKLFVATSNGLLVFDRQGQLLASWPTLLTYDLPGENYLSVNGDGSRFGLISRNQGQWEARIYTVQGAEAILDLTLPIEGTFQDVPRLALAPDNLFVAYGGGNLPLSVINLDTQQAVLTQPAGVDALDFVPGGAMFATRRSRELLFWPTAAWKKPGNLLLPREDTPYAFSPDGKTLALATATKIRTYALDTLKIALEIDLGKDSGEWHIAFVDNKRLRGYGVRWNSQHTQATVTLTEWDVQSEETLRTETSETDAPDALSALWGAKITAPQPQTEVEVGSFNGFRFIGADMLLVNGQHSACWIKLSTGEKNCFNDPQNIVFTGDGQAFREVRQTSTTLLQNWKGDPLFEVAPYGLYAVNRTGDFILVNARNATTDLYAKGKKLPVESLAGKLMGFAENGPLLALSAQEKSGAVSITLIEKESHATVLQKKESFVLKPLVMTNKGVIYFLRFHPDWKYAILLRIEPGTYTFSEVTRLPLSEAPELLTLSTTGIFALGLKDGRVLLLTEDGQQSAAFQAANSALNALTFSGDGRFLAISSQEGIKVWGVVP